MKTIIKNGVYERVSDEVGEFKVRNQGYKFVSKSEWKLNFRDLQKKEEPKIVVEEKQIVKKKNYQKPKKS